MDALVMCGGRGTRMGADVEKPLLRVGEEAMIDHVRGALAESAIDQTYAIVSPNAPGVHEYLREVEVPCIETPGAGYVADLAASLDEPALDPPVLTAAADLPLLEAPLVDEVLATYERRRRTVTSASCSREPTATTSGTIENMIGTTEADYSDTIERSSTTHEHAPSMTVCVPVDLKRKLGLRVESRLPANPTLAPAGLNVVGAECTTDMRYVLADQRLAVNVNRPEDGRIAEALDA